MVDKTVLSGIFGAENVLSNEEISSRNGFSSGIYPTFIVKPHSAEEIREIIELANKERFPVIPISSGGPHNSGGIDPSTKDAVLVDLSDMKKIIRLDARNKVALIEPGVTFDELKAKADEAGLRVLMPLLPRKSKSVLASCLEREPFTIPKYQWDTTDPLMCMEIVFGTGDLYRTGSAAGPGTIEEQWETGAAQKNPLGPGQWDALRLVQGSQGTMGIATWGSVKLELLPKAQKCFFVPAQRLEDLVDFTYRIQKFKLADVCFVMNASDLSAVWAREAGRSTVGFPPWVLVYSISGYEYFPTERIEYIEKEIEEIAGETSASPVSEISGVTADEIVHLITKPCDEPYWKKRLRGSCRDIFFITTLERVPGFLEIMDAVAKKHHFPLSDVGIYIQPVQQGRNCHLEFSLMYDGESPVEAERVSSLFGEASEAFVKAGAFYSRPYGVWADLAYRNDPHTVKALKMVKNMLDPGEVMNPGKLCFRREV